MTILVIEDNALCASLIESSLTKIGYEIFVERDGQTGLDKFREAKIDLVILDLLLPKINGEQVLTKIRQTSNIPIIIISTKTSEMSKTVCFRLGSDDYLTKPFSMVELEARINAIFRRQSMIHNQSKKIVKNGDVLINLDSHEAFIHEKQVQLTPIQFKLLYLFIDNPKQIFTKEHISRYIWKNDSCNDNAVIVQIANLRKAIQVHPEQPSIIKTIWGVGYQYNEMDSKSS
jgi:DNA-binding response OmpR family regulator